MACPTGPLWPAMATSGHDWHSPDAVVNFITGRILWPILCYRMFYFFCYLILANVSLTIRFKSQDLVFVMINAQFSNENYCDKLSNARYLAVIPWILSFHSLSHFLLGLILDGRLKPRGSL